MRTMLPSLLLLLCFGAHLSASEPATQVEALALVEQAQAALVESDTKPERIIDAALGFAAALPWYEAQGDTDTICDLQASLFWCRKRMDADTMKIYRAKLTNGDAGTRATLARVDAVSERAIDASEVQGYMDRADLYAKAHPQELHQIAIRYYEVAVRFQGTPSSLTAQRLSLEAQQQWAKELTAAGKNSSDNTPSLTDAKGSVADATSAASAANTKIKPPDAETVTSLTTKIKELYKASYANSKGRTGLVDIMIAQAEKSDQDTASRYVLLTEARELAVGVRHVFAVMSLCEQLATTFTGPTNVEQQRQHLARISGIPVVPALLKLFDQPDDAAACTVAGRWFAVDVQAWDRALPLLVKSNDAPLNKAATQELASNSRSIEQLSIADQWYDIGKRASSATKESFWRHALEWYSKGTTGLSGAAIATATKRISEIEEFLPLGPDADYSKISPGQWEKLKGAIFTVDSNRGRMQTNVVLSEGHSVRVVPHPTETWSYSDGRSPVAQTTWKGASILAGDIGALRCVVGTDEDKPPGIITGTGPLMLFAQRPQPPAAAGGGGGRGGRGGGLAAFAAMAATMNGSIRVKVIPLTVE